MEITNTIGDLRQQIHDDLRRQHPESVLQRLRYVRDGMIRNLFEISTEHERRERAECIARAQRNFLRWVKKAKVDP